jgi:hypothetical protein
VRVSFSKQNAFEKKIVSYVAELNILLQPTIALINTAAAKTVIVCFTVTPKTGGKKADKRILAEACRTSKKSKLSAIIGALRASA